MILSCFLREDGEENKNSQVLSRSDRQTDELTQTKIDKVIQGVAKVLKARENKKDESNYLHRRTTDGARKGKDHQIAPPPSKLTSAHEEGRKLSVPILYPPLVTAPTHIFP